MKDEFPILLGSRTRPVFQFKAQVIWTFHAIPHLYWEKTQTYVHRHPSDYDENKWGDILEGAKGILQTCIKKLSLILLENPNLPKGLSQESHIEKNALSSSYE